MSEEEIRAIVSDEVRRKLRRVSHRLDAKAQREKDNRVAVALYLVSSTVWDVAGEDA